MTTTTVPLPIRTKQPDEIRSLTFDFRAKLPAGVTLSGNPTTFGDAGITVGLGTIIGKTVTLQVSGGELGHDYKVTVRVDATNGDHVELDVIVKVREQN